jgi:Domain of unknown function (DUF4349)/Putative zinc-finger
MSKPNHIVEPEELIAYLDGELPAEQALDTAAHLEHCGECRKLAAELKEVSEMLVAWEVEEVGGELPQAIASELDGQRQERKMSDLLKRWPGVRFPTGREVVWGSAMAVVVLIIFAISIPNLMRSRMLSERAAQAARERDKAKYEESHPGLPEDLRSKMTRAPVPSAKPVPKVGVVDGVGSAGKLQASNGRFYNGQSDVALEEAQESAVDNAVDLKSPMIIRTAHLAVIVTNNEFDKARAAIDEILKRHHGHVGDLNVTNPAGSARSLTGTLRVPSTRLDAAIADLKRLGRVEKESQGGEEVTQQYVDLQARLANSKHTEQRLTEILRQRTGKLSDVLAVEMQISRVRGEIEQMEAQRKTMKNQVDFATLNLTVTEDYKKELTVAPPSIGTQFRNAAVDGYRSVVDGILAVLLWLLSVGPTLLLWAAILFFPVRMAWRKARHRFARQ